MIVTEDSIHCETNGNFEKFEDAIAELRRRAAIQWDQPPNRAPCTAWRTCGREYRVLEFDVSHGPWKLLRNIAVLNMSAKGVNWVSGFERAWALAERA